eukprot:NODE_3822_length_1279_cov_46.160900_g3347_i0.p1 GENE.NODE_3822_length_1279_cov_46.160900_g3347_i0~~NODE_3822_length_1279_cov_46.160900_g3347_i0.p1  ORF type:complete len:401 (-),score=41.34 NODE_3822_length_1279_cov_46.160900_g3347_i0:77-1237(-)
MFKIFICLFVLASAQQTFNIVFQNNQNQNGQGTPVTIDVAPTNVRTWTGVPYADINAKVGDVIVFVFRPVVHNVARFKNKTVYDQCTVLDNSTFEVLSQPPSSATPYTYNFTVDREGDHYIACTFANHCEIGMKVTIHANGTAVVPVRRVLNYQGPYWTVFGYPNMTIQQGDTLRFLSVYIHNLVIYKNAADYISCNTDNTTFQEILDWDGTAKTVAKEYKFDVPGVYYLACTEENGVHCNFGQKFVLTVLPMSNYTMERYYANTFNTRYLQQDMSITTLFGNGATVEFPYGTLWSSVFNASTPAGKMDVSTFFNKWNEVLLPTNGAVEFVTFSAGTFVTGLRYRLTSKSNSSKVVDVRDIVAGTLQGGYINNVLFRIDPAYQQLV